MALTPLITSPDDLKRTMGTQPPMLPGIFGTKPDQGPPSGGLPSLGELPPLSSVNTSSLPSLKPIVTNPRQQQEQQLQTQMLQKPEGFWQNLRHVAGMAGRIVGDVVAPGTTELITRQLGKEGIGPEANQFRAKQLAGLQAEDRADQNQFGENMVHSATAANQGASAAKTAEETALMPDQGAAVLRETNARADSLANPAPEYDVHDTTNGPMVVNKRTGVGQHLSDNGLPIGPKVQTKTVQLEIGGKPHQVLVDDADGSVIRDMGLSGEKPAQAPGVTMIVPNAEGGGTVQRVGVGGTIGPGAVTASGMSAMNTPTAQSRNMAEMAKTVLPQMQAVTKEIDQLAGGLGPAVGRWNQLMVNKGGTEYPEFAKLDTDLDLMASAIVRTHFGARGGQQYREELKKMFGEAQTPDDLKARIAGADGWLQGYAHMADTGGKGQAQPGNQPGAGAPPAGAKVRDYTQLGGH